jgi:hypothetical protein
MTGQIQILAVKARKRATSGKALSVCACCDEEACRKVQLPGAHLRIFAP